MAITASTGSQRQNLLSREGLTAAHQKWKVDRAGELGWLEHRSFPCSGLLTDRQGLFQRDRAFSIGTHLGGGRLGDGSEVIAVQASLYGQVFTTIVGLPAPSRGRPGSIQKRRH